MERTSLLKQGRQFLENLYHCSHCNYCVEMTWEEAGIQHVCPTLLHHNPSPGYSGKGYLAAARALADGEELPVFSLAERFFACTTCGNCEEVCPIGLKPAQLVKAVRTDLAGSGAAPPEIFKAREHIVQFANPWGYPKAERDQWRGTSAEDKKSSAEVLFLPGCAAAYKAPSEASAMLRVLSRAGIQVGTISAERDCCCGAILFETGLAEDGRTQLESLVRMIEHTGARRVVIGSAECLETLRSQAPAILDRKPAVPVLSPLEILANKLDEIPRRRDAKSGAPARRVGVLDGCHLSKKSHGLVKETDFPALVREVMARLGIAVTPDKTAAAYALCCGAAGGFPELHPQSADLMARATLERFARSGVEAIVSPSPLCVAHLRQARSESELPVYGLWEFVEQFFEPAAG